ncbi:MAG: SurA N-terminal domain-containing protein [Gammaproteobacteria bacterium]|nr:SurA N-terminal domain-containing protein [Gammaproteobacteria bacterium]MCH9744426.1 SurA N-terminal domain-containing protein [Gammaproteobacteria bacterium]
MLQLLNKLITKWVIIVVVSIIAIAFMFWGIQFYIQGETGAQAPVAKVDGIKITQKDLDNVFQSFQRRVQQQQGGVPLTEQQNTQLKKYALQNLIQQVALSHAASQTGLYVGLDQAQQIIMSDPGFQTQGQFDPQRLQQLVYANGLTMDQFYSQFQQNLVTQQMQSGIQNSAIILPNELQQAYALVKQKRDFGYLILPKAHYKNKVNVTLQSITDYYQQNKAQFQTPEKISIDYIVLSPQEIGQHINVTQQQLQDYYQTNQVNYTVPKRWQIQKIALANQQQVQWVQKQLQQGKTFSNVAKAAAKRFGVPPSSPQWLSQAMVSQQLADFLSDLSVKQVSAPFRTSSGFAIVKLLDVQAAKVRPFATIKDRLRKTLVQQKLDQLLSEKNEQLSNLTYTNPNTLAPAAKALNVPVRHSLLFERSAKLSGVLADPKVVAAAFSEDVLTQGVNSNPISLKDGSLMVLRVAKRVPSKLLPLASVQTKIKTQLQDQYADRMAGLDAYKVQTALQKKNSGPALAKQFDTQWHQVSNVARDNKTIDAQLVQSAFATQPQGTNSIQLKNGNYAVLYVNTLVSASFAAASAKQRALLQQRLQNLWGQLAYQIYVKSVMNNAKIKILNKSLIMK